MLNRLVLPQRPDVPMNKVSFSGNTLYYTVEARQESGYEKLQSLLRRYIGHLARKVRRIVT